MAGSEKQKGKGAKEGQAPKQKKGKDPTKDYASAWKDAGEQAEAGIEISDTDHVLTLHEPSA